MVYAVVSKEVPPDYPPKVKPIFAKFREMFPED